MQGASGKIGKTLVFRQAENGETIIANRAKKSRKPPHPKQLESIDKFTVAAYIAKIYAKDPILGPQYAEKGKKLQKTAYNMAMQDCLRPPIIKTVDLGHYSGAIGSIIVVRAVDDFKVTSVTVKIIAANETVIEQGYATFQEGGLDWVYVATTANATLSGTKVEVTAADTPGNQTVQVEQIN